MQTKVVSCKLCTQKLSQLWNNFAFFFFFPFFFMTPAIHLNLIIVTYISGLDLFLKLFSLAIYLLSLLNSWDVNTVHYRLTKYFSGWVGDAIITSFYNWITPNFYVILLRWVPGLIKCMQTKFLRALFCVK